MNILFLTMVSIDDLNTRGIYHDLLRKFKEEGHQVSIVSPKERRYNKPTHCKKIDGVNFLSVQTLNIKKTNLVEKGLGILAIEYQFLRAIKRHLKTISFDLVLYSTPPITFSKVVRYIKYHHGASSYLLLKDIFPQNAVDMKMLKSGSLLHRYFMKRENQLYKISDFIGCMSPANVEYLKRNIPHSLHNKIEVNPNSIEPHPINLSNSDKKVVKHKYGLPHDKRILVYGGNLGKPQGLDFLLTCIDKADNENFHYLIVGDGTEFKKIDGWFKTKQPNNASLLQKLPKSDYDLLLNACDVGLIFLDPNFTIPNFPSRLLPYLEMSKPVISVTDEVTDIGDILEKAKCGFKVFSGDLEVFTNALKRLNDDKTFEVMSGKAYSLLLSEYTVSRSYELIISKLKK